MTYKLHAFALGLLVVSALHDVARADSPPATPLPGTGGIVASLSGDKGSWRYFTVYVPDGANLRVWSGGGTGDADLYLGAGQAPTASDYALFPNLAGNRESIDLVVGGGGTWWIGVYGYADFSGLFLQVQTDIPWGAPLLGAYETKRDLAGTSGSWRFYRLSSLFGAGPAKVRVRSGSGNLTVYAKTGSKPSIGWYDAKSLGGGTWHDLTVESTAGGAIYVGLYGGWSGYSGVELQLSAF